jgi:oligoribonuclease
MKDRLVWIDCEMTGLDLGSDALIEIAALVTDGELKILDSGVDFVIKPRPGAVERMSQVVREMHTASGLLEALPNGIPLAEAEAKVLDYVRTHVPEPNRAPLCGNSIATDRSFLARDMPALDAYLHYRMVDVSSVKELVRRWYPRVYFASPGKKGGHRALADITESITELRYYRSAVFVPHPGPDSETARGVAARVAGGQESDGARTEGPPPAARPDRRPDPQPGDGRPVPHSGDARERSAGGAHGPAAGEGHEPAAGQAGR